MVNFKYNNNNNNSNILKSIKYFFLKNGVQINKEHLEGYMETQCDKVIGLFNRTNVRIVIITRQYKFSDYIWISCKQQRKCCALRYVACHNIHSTAHIQ